MEPVFIELEAPMQPTEHGERWLDKSMALISKFGSYLRDISKVAELEVKEWDTRLHDLYERSTLFGIPLAASGFSQYVAPKILDYCDGVTTTAFNPAAQRLALSPYASCAYATTGVTIADGTSNYTGYGRFDASTPGNWFNTATTGAAPAQITSKASIAWPGCSGGSSITENCVGFADNASNNTGNLYFWATITAVTISPTQTPPTIASGQLTISLNTT